MSTKYVCDDGYQLGAWISKQRHVRNGSVRGIMTEDRIKKLDEMGMVWEPLKATEWYMNYLEAKAFYRGYGHLCVLKAYTDLYASTLAAWVNRQYN